MAFEAALNNSEPAMKHKKRRFLMIFLVALFTALLFSGVTGYQSGMFRFFEKPDAKNTKDAFILFCQNDIVPPTPLPFLKLMTPAS